jgi:hypothetical protein
MQRVSQSEGQSQRLASSTNPDSQPYKRSKEHGADALRLLAFLIGISQDASWDACPSTAELQADGRFGLRPVNRLVDLRHGKYNRTRYDIEMRSFGRGVNRWRIHWPNRPGYPKDKRQGTLALETPKQEIPWNERKPVTGLELFDAAVL